ncbi:MAG: putative protease YhbU precursor [Candidatus Lokiarchaeum sp. GC14_75]|nr:MAG: putative protease YhbU precursor [Candidatus Lokiarchaeum sp. GC14_75]
MEFRPELLAPVQDWNSLKIVSGLADAVYFGVENYNMRNRAKNFERKDLKKVVDFCHNQNPPLKTYLTTNILIYDSELQDLENLISEAKTSEIDAIIAHDLAAIRIAKRYNIKFHISTQANVSNIEAAKFFEGLGAERIILARELSLEQIRLIKHLLTTTKIECFVHGSMCTSISGRCYFSATICNSEQGSANRGNCLQPCRREWRVIDDSNNEFIYDGQMFLNAKDLCMIEYIPELINAKIDTFKIEGRMKDPLYVKTVTECYKEALDAHLSGTYSKIKIQNWIERLSKVYNRGYHTGFYFSRPTIKDIEFERRGNKSPFRKHYIGKILSYDKISKTANVLIENQEISLKLGDEIIIEGSKTYMIEKIKRMIYKGSKIEAIMRNDFIYPAKINLRVNTEVKQNDKIFKFLRT